MVRQRWSEAGLFRRLTVVFLRAQALLIAVALGVFANSLESATQVSLLAQVQAR